MAALLFDSHADARQIFRVGGWLIGSSELGVNTGLGLLGVLISVVSLLGIMENQMLFQRDWWPGGLQTIQNMDPGLGWVLLVCAGVIFYFAMVPPSTKAWKIDDRK